MPNLPPQSLPISKQPGVLSSQEVTMLCMASSSAAILRKEANFSFTEAVRTMFKGLPNTQTTKVCLILLFPAVSIGKELINSCNHAHQIHGIS